MDGQKQQQQQSLQPAPPPPLAPPPAYECAEPSDEYEYAQPPTKRQRVSQACGPCRDRKTRCDGRQPVCRACEGRNVSASCNYDYVRRQRQSRNSIQKLPSDDEEPQSAKEAFRETSFRAAENPEQHANAAQALSELGRSRQPDEHEVRPAPQVLTPTPLVVNSTIASGTEQNGTYLARDRPHGTPGVAHDWHGARADGLATLASGSDVSMYGPSSTVAFLRHVMPSQSGAALPGHMDQERNANELRPRSAVIPDRQVSRSEGLAVLPRRRQADNFLLCYWEFIHPLFPVLHRPTFLRKYEKLWTGDNNDSHRDPDSELEDATFTSTLNLVFAIGCKFSTLVDPAQKSTVSEDLFQRSRQSYAFDILDSTSVSAVQMLILTGVYLQSTQHASRCWNSVGLAIRMAQSLGLHVDNGGRQLMSQVETQMRRRIWHTCVHLDRLLAMTFGRPSMVDKAVDLPIPDLVDDEYLEERGGGVQPPGVPSRLGMFVTSCHLLELLEGILQRFYRDGAKHTNGVIETINVVTPVLDLNRQLDAFSESVPDYLRFFGGQGKQVGRNEDHIQLQQQVLYCRFLYVRLLSLRPLLVMTTKRGSKPPSYSLDEEVVRSCNERCVSTACRLVDAVHDNIGTLYRSSGWHSVYFTFAAAMTFLASWKIDDYQPPAKGDDRDASWNRCLAILEHYENQINSAAHAIKILKRMRAQIGGSARTSGRPTNSATTPLDPALRPRAEGLPTSGTDMYATLDMATPNLFDLANDNISDAWYNQQLINLDWLDIPQMYT